MSEQRAESELEREMAQEAAGPHGPRSKRHFTPEALQTRLEYAIAGSKGITFSWDDMAGLIWSMEFYRLRAAPEVAEPEKVPCSACDGEGEVYAPCGAPDEDGWVPCATCGGSEVQPTNGEVAELRTQRDEMAYQLGVLAKAAERAFGKSVCGWDGYSVAERLDTDRAALRSPRIEKAEPHQIEHEVELIARCLYRRKLMGAWVDATTEERAAYRALAIEERAAVMREAAKEAANLPRIEGDER